MTAFYEDLAASTITNPTAIWWCRIPPEQKQHPCLRDRLAHAADLMGWKVFHDRDDADRSAIVFPYLFPLVPIRQIDRLAESSFMDEGSHLSMYKLHTFCIAHLKLSCASILRTNGNKEGVRVIHWHRER